MKRASDQLAKAGDAVSKAREDLAKASKEGGKPGAEAQAAEEALQDAEEALQEASEQLAEAAEGGGDPAAMNASVSNAQEALDAAEEALAAAGAAAGEDSQDTSASAGSEEVLAGAEPAESGGAEEDLPGAEDTKAGGAAGPPMIVVAVAGAEGSLEQAQGALAEALRALIITGVYLPPGGTDGESNGLPPGGVIVLMPGEPGQDTRVAELESELEGTLVVFDGRLLSERNRIASQRSGGTAIGVPGGDEELDPGAEAAALLEQMGGAGPDSEGAEVDGESKTGTGDVASVDDMGQGKKDTNTARPANIPEGVPDGRDDDIVARQIREAAMNETDPVLREKLWREYINYKNGS